MNYAEFKLIIPKLKLTNLNSKVSQLKLAPSFRKDYIKLNKKLNLNSKKAAVIALLYPDNNKLMRLVLILRNTYNGVHSNQIGFPGGKVEVGDKTMFDTAARETFEEIGIRLFEKSIIKELHSLYIPPSNFSVSPFLAYVDFKPDFMKDDKEVKEVFSIDLDSLITATINELSIKVPDNLNYSTKTNNKLVPSFLLGGYNVWGATAMMLSEIRDLFKNVI